MATGRYDCRAGRGSCCRSPEDAHRGSSSEPPNTPESLSSAVAQNWISFIDGIEAPQQKQFLRGFLALRCHVLALPVDEHGDAIMSAILSVSREEPMVLDAVLAVGAAYCINQLAPDAAERAPLIREKQRLLHSVTEWQATRSTHLQSVLESRAEKVAACDALLLSHLLLYYYELVEGTGDISWQTQLDRAWDVLDMSLDSITTTTATAHSNSPQSNPNPNTWTTHTLILHLLLYHDTFRSITAPRPSHDSLPDTLLDPLTTIHNLHSGLLGLISRIASLHTTVTPPIHTQSQSESYTHTQPHIHTPKATTISTAAQLSQSLSDWAPPHDPALSPSQHHMWEAYRVACFLWLYAIVYPDGLADTKVQTMVRRGVECLAAMEDPEVRTCSLVPVFVVGMACTDPTDRGVVEHYMQKVQQVRGLGSGRVCGRVLRSGWARCDRGEGWGSIMGEGDGSVSLV